MLCVALALAALVTGPKLYWRCQVKGLLPGATEHVRTVLETWHQGPDEHPRNRNVYWLRIAEGDIRENGQHRLHLAPKQWARIQVGDQLTMVSVGRSTRLYLPAGVFTSPLNFVFDVVLLLLELGCAMWMGWRLRRDSGG
jgi:hypothetical protein